MKSQSGPWARAALTLTCVVVLLAAFLGFRTLSAMGVFTQIKPGFAGVCRTISGINGPGDIQIDAPDRLLFISSQNRRARTPDGKDGIYTLSLDGSAAPVRVEGAPKDFHPGGLSLFRGPDNALTLMVVNRHAGGFYSIEILDVTVTDGVAKLAPRTTVAGGLLIHPNDVVAAGPAAFYVTNDTTVKNPRLRDFANYALLRQGNVVYFDGANLRVAARGLDFPNGIQLSPHSDYLYVAVSFGRGIVTYVRQPFTGILTDPQTLDLPTRPDNLDVDAQGNIWAGGQPKLGARPSPSQIFKVTVGNGLPQSAEAVYVNDGSQIKGSSTGAVLGKRLFISAGGDNKILDCKMN